MISGINAPETKAVMFKEKKDHNAALEKFFAESGRRKYVSLTIDDKIKGTGDLIAGVHGDIPGFYSGIIIVPASFLNLLDKAGIKYQVLERDEMKACLSKENKEFLRGNGLKHLYH